MTDDRARAVAVALYKALYTHTHHGFILTELGPHDEEGVDFITATFAAIIEKENYDARTKAT